MTNRLSIGLRAALCGVPLIVFAVVAARLIFLSGEDTPPGPPPRTTAQQENRPPSAAGPVLPPSFPASEYLTTRPDTTYVGSSACIDCHKDNHRSYLLTAHSQALADIDLAVEPPDGKFEHAPSGRTYRVYREGGKLRHEETLRDPSGRVVARTDHPVRYVVGSGHFCRSYLIEVDGFLHESPITWYTGRGRYDMSPGYDFAHHWSFERPVTQGCLKCHSGGAVDNGAVHKPTIREHAVGCESCHGPGSKHVEFRRSGQSLGDKIDLTIVNPGNLSRPLMEAVCAECHLGSVASVRLRGRGPDDFRPGMPLTHVRMDYRAVGADEAMTVTGHFEQLRLSQCYQKSELTCLTCHDPHAERKPADPIAHHRQNCLNCHTSERCAAPTAQRAKTTPADNCLTCHMPKSDTDIPHLAFSHHRIGVHRGQPAPPSTAPTLEPLADESHLSPADRKRNLALAYLSASDRPGLERFESEFEARALHLLEAAFSMGLRDPETTQWLARLTFPHDPRRAVEYARLTIADRDAVPEMRAPAMMILANGDFREKRYTEAIDRLNQLVRLRRQADDWRFLGDCYLLAGNLGSAREAFQQAIQIRPTRPINHRGLAETYRRLGNATRSTEHQSIARFLELKQQD